MLDKIVLNNFFWLNCLVGRVYLDFTFFASLVERFLFVHFLPLFSFFDLSIWNLLWPSLSSVTLSLFSLSVHRLNKFWKVFSFFWTLFRCRFCQFWFNFFRLDLRSILAFCLLFTTTFFLFRFEIEFSFKADCLVVCLLNQIQTWTAVPSTNFFYTTVTLLLWSMPLRSSFSTLAAILTNSYPDTLCPVRHVLSRKRSNDIQTA